MMDMHVVPACRLCHLRHLAVTTAAWAFLVASAACLTLALALERFGEKGVREEGARKKGVCEEGAREEGACGEGACGQGEEGEEAKGGGRASRGGGASQTDWDRQRVSKQLSGCGQAVG